MGDYELFTINFWNGESYVTEYLMVNWILTMYVITKGKYFNIILFMIDVLYGELSAYNFEEVQWNQFVRLHT